MDRVFKEIWLVMSSICFVNFKVMLSPTALSHYRLTIHPSQLILLLQSQTLTQSSVYLHVIIDSLLLSIESLGFNNRLICGVCSKISCKHILERSSRRQLIFFVMQTEERDGKKGLRELGPGPNSKQIELLEPHLF